MRITGTLQHVCLFVLAALPLVRADGEQQQGYYAANNNDDDNNNNNAAAAASEYAVDGIDYWTDYAILPKACITYNNVDVVVFSLYEQGYKQCVNDPVGTYYASVPSYATAYFTQMQDNADNEGIDYQAPSVAQYTSCTQFVTDSGKTYYVQLGCADSGTQKLAVNIFTDNACTKRSTQYGSDDAAIDVSDINVRFGSCTSCVIWFDKADDQVDDQYWRVHKNDAPLCSLLYQSKTSCSGSCLSATKAAAKAAATPDSWSSSERYAIAFLFLFGAALTYNVLNITYLQAKDKLLQEAANDSDLDRPVEVDPMFKKTLIGAVASMGVLSLILALLTLKAATWFFLFGTVAVLFAYALKLTMETGVKACGGDTTYEYDSEDEEEEKASKSRNSYTAPTDPAEADALPDTTDTPAENENEKVNETAAESSGVVA